VEILSAWPHVICCQQEEFSRQWLEGKLFPQSRDMRKIVDSRGGCDILRGKRVVLWFYQKSTRTHLAFQTVVEERLGGRVSYSTPSARDFSGASVGESLLDTMIVINRMHKPDAIVLRYDREIGAEIAATVSMAPIINAGDRQPKGLPPSPFAGQHPTQAFLDIFTIQERLGGIDGISIAMVGDLENGRTVRSLSYLLGKFNGVIIYYVSPRHTCMREDVKDYLGRRQISFYEVTDLRDVAGLVDVVYQTRTQTECGGNIDRNDHDLGYFIVDKDIVRRMKKDAIIMHPLPRVDEITRDVDEDPRAVYLTDQIDAGIYTRMALLKMILAPNAQI